MGDEEEHLGALLAISFTQISLHAILHFTFLCDHKISLPRITFERRHIWDALVAVLAVGKMIYNLKSKSSEYISRFLAVLKAANNTPLMLAENELEALPRPEVAVAVEFQARLLDHKLCTGIFSESIFIESITVL